MILDAHLHFEKTNKGKSAFRLDLVSYSEIYEPIYKPNKAGDVWIYLSPYTDNIKASSNRKGAMTISTREGNHISSVFIPNLERHTLAFGDVMSTNDAIIFLIGDGMLDMFIAKGKKHSVNGLFDLLLDGELDAEIQFLREKTRSLQKQNHTQEIEIAKAV